MMSPVRKINVALLILAVILSILSVSEPHALSGVLERFRDWLLRMPAPTVPMGNFWV